MNFKQYPVGIDLGTTNSCIGVFRNGEVEIIPNQFSGRTTPSVVAFGDKEISIGEQIFAKEYIDPEKVIYSVKRIIGKKWSDDNFQKLRQSLAYKNKIIRTEKDKPKISVNFDGKEQLYYPEEISAMVLKRLKENAEIVLNQEIKKVVITIPAYFTETQRECTKIAAEGAGLEVIKIINEPTAAALAYGLRNVNHLLRIDEDHNFFLLKDNGEEKEEFEEKIILVFDFGGGTLDVTCLKLFNDGDSPEFEVLGHSGNTLLGGDDFDNILVDYCIKNFNKEFKESIKINDKKGIKARKRLKIECEKKKKILSFDTNTSICLDGLYNDNDFKINITRAKFEYECRNIFKEMLEPIKKALKISNLNKNEVNEILLVGGTTRIPKIKEELLGFFGNIKICDSINPDEVVAYGATVQAAILLGEKSMRGVVINDICSHSLGVAVYNFGSDCKFDKLIDNGTNIPYVKEGIYTTAFDYQTSVLIQIYEGENVYCKDNRLLGEFTLENITEAKEGVPKIKIKFEIDENSVLQVTAKEELSGVVSSLIIKSNKGIMNKNEINTMKNRLEKSNFEKSPINEAERQLFETKNLLIDDFKDNFSFKTLLDLVKTEEELVKIISKDKNNISEKKFSEVKCLFTYYDFLFSNYFEDYKKEADKYLIKIKNYLDLFKNDDPYFLKNLVETFMEDKYDYRISQIVYHCITLFQNNMKKSDKFISIYKIKNSTLGEKFTSIEKECKIEINKQIIKEIEKETPNSTTQDEKNINLDKAISAIDHFKYCIEIVGNITSSSSKYEKAMRAYFITKLVDYELKYLNYINNNTLQNKIQKALELVDECNLTEESDPWVKNLKKCQNIVEKERGDQKEKEGSEKINKVSNMVNSFSINGDDDDNNIELLKVFYKEFIKEDVQNEIDVEEEYKKDTEKLLRKSIKILKNTQIKNEKGNSLKKVLHEKLNIIKEGIKKGLCGFKNFFKRKLLKID